MALRRPLDQRPLLVLMVMAIATVSIIFFSVVFLDLPRAMRKLNYFGPPSVRRLICDPPPHSLAGMVQCALQDLTPGRLAFEPKKEMDQGRPETVFVRISQEAAADLSKGFKEGPPAIQAIRVGPLMRAVLDYSPEEFRVRRIGDEKKVLTPPFTEWSWEVTPLKGGEKLLRVLAYAELMLPNGNREPYEAYTGSAVIHVHTRPLYVVGKFSRDNWQWLLGSPILLGLLGWVGTRMLKEKSRRAGFE